MALSDLRDEHATLLHADQIAERLAFPLVLFRCVLQPVDRGNLGRTDANQVLNSLIILSRESSM